MEEAFILSADTILFSFAHGCVRQGYVYLKFASVEGSAAAQKQLHGRWFAGRQVVAEFQFTAVYNGHFRV